MAKRNDDVPLVPSEGVGSGGAGHTTKSLLFRLPPPIPGKPGGGYPEEYHKAATLVQRNVKVYLSRRQHNMKEVKLDASTKAPAEPLRKRDRVLNYVKSVAGVVTESLSKTVVPAALPLQEMFVQRQQRYTGWLLEKVKTKGAVGFFLARQGDQAPGALSPFEETKKREKVASLDPLIATCGRTG